jgi:outer membrane murein-binding lipoprotein Lpp
MTRSLLTVVLALTLLAGCGGGDDPSTGEFVADANRICREGAAKTDEIARQQQEAAGDLESLEQQRQAVATTLERTAEAYEPYMERLRALDPPSDLDENWTSFLDGVERAFDLIPDLAEATRGGDQQRLTELSEEFTQIARETRPFAEDNGLDDCLPDQSS